MKARPPMSQKIIYALGQLGWCLASFSAINLLIYFYMPSEASQDSANFPTFIFQGAVLGVLTIVGVINFGSRIFDAITDPWIANWSDQISSTFGKRKLMMAIGVIPFALFSFLIFYPISDDIAINSWWLIFTIVLFYLSMTVYVVPYTALISELGHQKEDRMLISTLISVTWALGFLIGNSAYAVQALFEQSRSSTEAFQLTVGIFSIVSFIFMLVPILFLKENTYCEQKAEAPNIKAALRTVFKDKNYLYFMTSDLMYWLAVTFIQSGVSFYITILFGLEKAYASLFMTIGFLSSFLLYVPINILVKKIGKKRTLSIAFLAFSVTFGLTVVADLALLPRMPLFYLLAILSAFPLACFGIIPNAIIADVVHAHEARTGQAQAGMFYAVRNFMMKLGVSLANLLFPSLLLLGNSIDNPMGVRGSAVCAFVFCLIGYGIFLQYQEPEVIIE